MSTFTVLKFCSNFVQGSVRFSHSHPLLRSFAAPSAQHPPGAKPCSGVTSGTVVRVHSDELVFFDAVRYRGKLGICTVEVYMVGVERRCPRIFLLAGSLRVRLFFGQSNTGSKCGRSRDGSSASMSSFIAFPSRWRGTSAAARRVLCVALACISAFTFANASCSHLSSRTLHFVLYGCASCFDFITAHVVLTVTHSHFRLSVRSFCKPLLDIARAYSSRGVLSAASSLRSHREFFFERCHFDMLSLLAL